ncbi:MAG: family 43 glycosylhydrolase [Clostridia bacterium]|nr:family 43 glycosylhydrolase [Clostridia bacterium]
MKLKRLSTILVLLVIAVLITVAANAAETFAPGSSAAYFVDNSNGKDTNAGTSASAPLKTLGKANAYLREIGGGTIVICGEVAISSAFAPADVGGAVTYTSVWNSVDYRSTNGAKLVIGASMAFSNDTYFKNINLSITASTLIFSGRCNNFGFGSGVTVTNDSVLSSFTYPTIIGGWNNPGTLDGSSNSNNYSVHVYSGTWNSVSAGHRRTSESNPVSSLRGDIALIIKGGTFKDNVYGTGMNIHTGRFYMGISGGTFESAVCPIKRLGTIGSSAECSVLEYTADVLVRISGGTFKGRFRLAENTIATTALTYPPKGDATVVVTGGTFGSDFVGYGVMGSVLLKYKESVLSADKIKGFPVFKTGSQAMSSAATEEARFTNPIGDKSDPYVIEKDGIYYYCFASSETVNGTAYAAVKVAAHGSVAFGELSAQMRSVFNASETSISNAKHEYWAPELHYFDAATVGAANAGWYIYVAADNGDNYNHRMYVLRATDPENPLSDYKMVGKITDSTNKWAIDGTVLQHSGKLYFVWSGWAGDTNVAQNIYIAQMSNPWTISSSRVLLSQPEYSWETHGNPDVNEGPQIIQYGGSTHIVYSASGSWDQYYCYGVLTLTGSNPLNASHWYKATSAKFSSGNGMYGPGHGSFVKDSTGDWWMIYHANASLNVPSDSTWWAERNVYAKKFSFTTTTLNGVSVKYPSFGTPAGATSTQYIDVRTADYHVSGDHLYSPLMKTTSGTSASLTKTCYICKATTTVCTVDVPTVAAAVNPSGGINVTVTPTVSGASGYIIYRSTSENGSYSQIGTTTSKTYTDTTAKVGTTYYYKVKQYVSNAYGSDATYGRLVSSASAATAGVSAVPARVSFSMYYDGEIVKLSWTARDTAEKYRIFRRVAGESEWEETIRMTAENSYIDSTVSPNTTYEYSVQDWTLVNGTYYYSQVGPAIKTITTTLYAAPTVTAKNTADGISLTSSTVSGASAYKFYRSTDGKNFTVLAKTDSTTYVDETAVADTTYYYRTRAYTSADGITVYTPVSENATVIKLDVITPLITYEGAEIKLSWSAVPTAAKYRIFKRVAGTSDWGDTLTMTEGTSYSDTDVTGGTTYEYAVQAWAVLGNEYCYGPLKVCTFTTKKLDTPTLTATNTAAGISITTTAISDAEGYKFYRSTDGVTFTQIAKTTETTYEDTTAVANKTYYYRARAYTSQGGANYSPLSESVGMIKLSPISVSFYYDGEILKLSWDASATATKYRIFKRVAGASDWGDSLIMSSTNFYIDTDVTANTTYEYAVQDWSPLGDKFCYGTLKLHTVTTSDPDAPTLSVTNNNGYALKITKVNDATGYIFYRSADGKNFTQIAKTTSNTYTDTTAVIGYTYYYRAHAYFQSGNTVNNGAYSNTVQINDYVYQENSSGTLYDAIKARNDSTKFTLLEKQSECGKEVVLHYASGELPAGEYVYGVYGDYITLGAKVSTDEQENYVITLPHANADAIIFADTPIVTYGDANNDGNISLIDAVKIIKYCVNIEDPQLDIAASDTNGDITTNIYDVLSIIDAILN